MAVKRTIMMISNVINCIIVIKQSFAPIMSRFAYKMPNITNNSRIAFNRILMQETIGIICNNSHHLLTHYIQSIVVSLSALPQYL